MERSAETREMAQQIQHRINDIVYQCPSPGFTDNPFYTAICRHSDKNTCSAPLNVRYIDFAAINVCCLDFAAINDFYLDLVETRGLISLVNDKHMDNKLEDLAYVRVLFLDCKQSTQYNIVISSSFLRCVLCFGGIQLCRIYSLLLYLMLSAL